MASMNGAEAEYDGPGRVELLTKLRDALGFNAVRPTAWACLWLSDIKSLEDIVSKSQVSPTVYKGFFESLETTTKIVQHWTQRTRVSYTPSTPRTSTIDPQSPSAQGIRGHKRDSDGNLVTNRGRKERDLAFERDQKKCVLTKAGEPIEVAHIYPFSLRHQTDSPTREASFWAILRIFWSKERVKAWHDAIFLNPAKTEVCQNLLCLGLHAHGYWQRAYFALKPIGIADDQKRLDVQFFWLRKNLHVIETSILQVPSSSASDQGPNLARLWNHESALPICSGQLVTLTTDDPTLRPLPDRRLLEMQWFLHRVTAMSGAADPQDEFDEDDTDDDISTGLRSGWSEQVRDEWDVLTGRGSGAGYF